MTQNEQILRHLKRYGTIIRMQAFQLYGVCNLWARCSELRDDGHKVDGYNVRVKTRHGAATVKKYYLVRR